MNHVSIINIKTSRTSIFKQVFSMHKKDTQMTLKIKHAIQSCTHNQAIDHIINMVFKQQNTKPSLDHATLEEKEVGDDDLFRWKELMFVHAKKMKVEQG